MQPPDEGHKMWLKAQDRGSDDCKKVPVTPLKMPEDTAKRISVNGGERDSFSISCSSLTPSPAPAACVCLFTATLHRDLRNYCFKKDSKTVFHTSMVKLYN